MPTQADLFEPKTHQRDRALEAQFEAAALLLVRAWQKDGQFSGITSRARLLQCLACQPLDASFEDYGNFYYPLEDGTGRWRVWGNFFTISAVFSFEGTVEDLAPLVAAIRANQASGGYAWAKAEDAAMKAERRALQEAHDAARAKHPWRA